MATNLLQGHKSEWALLKRHPEEDIFGFIPLQKIQFFFSFRCKFFLPVFNQKFKKQKEKIVKLKESKSGIQLAGGYVDSMSRCAELLDDTIDVSFSFLIFSILLFN